MSVPEPSKITTPWANAGLKNAIPAAADPVTGKAGFDLGFAAINMTAKEAGGIPPFGQDFNGILFSITEALRYMEAGGRPTFSAAMSTAIGGYPKGAIVLSNDGATQYQNQIDGNTNNPDVTSAGWLPIISSTYPVGAPIPWPLATPPAGFLMMLGQSFSAVTYPKLALAYPALVLPDLRGEFIRGWDNGRNVDPARSLLSSQGDAIREIIAAFTTNNGWMFSSGSGAMRTTGGSVNYLNAATQAATSVVWSAIDFAASRVVPTAIENRPRNITFNYIVRAA